MLQLLSMVLASSLAASDLPRPVRIGSGVSGHIHPAACVTKNGTIVVIYSQSDYKDQRLTRSTDGGKTWTKPVPFELTEKTSIYPGSLTTLADGRIVHAWNTWFPIEKNGKKDKSRFVQYAISEDEGKTWGVVASLPKNADATVHSVIRHPIVELGPDAWLFSLADRTILAHPKAGDEKPLGDGMKHGLVPIVRTTKGTLVSGAGLRSTDRGQTWQKISPFPKIGADGWRYEMVALKNGWLVASEIEGPGVGGNLIRYVVSRDDGLSWDFDRAAKYYDPGRPIGGRACPRTVQVDAETIGTVFYDVDAKQDGGPGVFFLRVPLSTLGSAK